MNEKEIQKIRQKIDLLPKGNIYTKHIRGKDYEYWQYRKDGKQISKRIRGEELVLIRSQIQERQRLEELLKKEPISTQNRVPVISSKENGMEGVRIGTALDQFAEGVREYQKRSCFSELKDYIYGPRTSMVLILYGLRRTGKTTLIQQVLLDMNPETRSRAAFIQVTKGQNLSEMNMLLRRLEKDGYQYVFIDEVTLLDDFIEGSALFSDIFAASGMKIVLSGTDSLGFLFSEDEQLYDRCRMIHTTFIPYGEFERVLGHRGIDEYIRYGGTMSLGGTDYNRLHSPFETEQSTNEYIDSAIAHNIQHSLKNYQYEGHFRALYDLYEKNELTGAINRVVEDINHRFTLETLTRTFISHDLGISRINLQRDREHPTTALSQIDETAVTLRLRRMLEIREKEEQEIHLEPEHAREIQEYLFLLDLIISVDDVIANAPEVKRSRTIFTQPGLRYTQASALIISLMQDPVYRDLGVRERTRITNRILDEIRGRMMEDIVLLETKKACPEAQVFPLHFPIGEFDMVVFYPEKLQCRIYEIKHSTVIADSQYRHLNDPEKCREAEKQYGAILEKAVIYRGENAVRGDIQYYNVEDYLRTFESELN